MRKIIWLLVNNIQVTISVTHQYPWFYVTNEGSGYFNLKKSVKIDSLSPSHVWKLSGFFIFIHNWIQEPDQKAKENFPVVLMRPSWKLFLEWLKQTLRRVQVYLREETLQPAQVALTKMPRNEAKIYQETDFLTTEGHLLTSSGCFLTLTSSLDIVQVRFTFVAFCLWAIKSPSFILSQTA